ncbi:MAG: ribbon-helix-helix domain-containing protein [Actinobacteria bacterium]|nr:ribbon-helix-helix domain-containing protein [Actinomycetota bacterium]MBU1943942.1 ribbon-helix-helix domain-containing protein [Actinomycetota bacterium]MBU2686970.1 ribbon-helix-helix domain-containing protein [Actinomycetota bacterium]
MPRKKIIQVPIDIELLEELDGLAVAKGVSRSQLIRESCERYARAEREAEMDAAYVEGYRKHPESDEWGTLGAALLAAKLEEEDA